MAFNGSGTFTRNDGQSTGAAVWQDARTAGRKIVALDHDSHDQDLAAGLTNCICKDGQSTITANIPFNNKKITGLLKGAANAEALAWDNFTWTEWTPTYGANGSMTFTSVSTFIGDYIQIGKLVLFSLYAQGTVGGTLNNVITFSLPVARAPLNSRYLANGDGVTGGLNYQCMCNGGVFNTTTGYCYLSGLGNWSSGTTSINIIGFYQAA